MLGIIVSSLHVIDESSVDTSLLEVAAKLVVHKPDGVAGEHPFAAPVEAL